MRLFYSGPGPGLEPVREAHARIVVRGALGEGAARGIAAKLARFRASQRQPFAAQVPRPEKADARKKGAASSIERRQRCRLLRRDAVEGLDRFRVRPRRLSEYSGENASLAVDPCGEPQVGLSAQIGVRVPPHARKQRDRDRAELLVPFGMQAEGYSGVDVRDIVTSQETGFACRAPSLVGELRPEVEPGRELDPRPAFEHALGRAREPGPAVVPQHRDQLAALEIRAVVSRPRAQAGADQDVIFRGTLTESRERDDKAEHERWTAHAVRFDHDFGRSAKKGGQRARRNSTSASRISSGFSAMRLWPLSRRVTVFAPGIARAMSCAARAGVIWSRAPSSKSAGHLTCAARSRPRA